MPRSSIALAPTLPADARRCHPRQGGSTQATWQWSIRRGCATIAIGLARFGLLARRISSDRRDRSWVRLPRGQYLEIKDRAKDIIISGGENISTVEVESVLYRHPAVLEASVVARPDSTWGEVPCAFVVLKDGVAWGEQGGAKAVDEQSIIQFCRGHLAHFKAPKHIVHAVEGLPKTSTGKVQKFELREKARTMARLAGDEPLNPDEENPER